MYAEIISVGNEILSGATLNTNTVFLARNLGLMGFDVHHQSVVGDNEDDIVEAVKIAGARSHVVILTGGLGPTKDDMTKEAVAKAFNLTLIESPAVIRQIKDYFEQRGRTVTHNNFKQAMVIQGGDVLGNPNGTAPGLLLQTATQAIAMLPGPPSEMEYMFEHELKPRLEQLAGDFSAGASLHVFGIGEADLEEQVRDLLYEQNPSAALYAKPGEVYIDIVAHSHVSQQEADELLRQKVDAFKQRVGENIYSEEGKTMAETVVDLLARKKARIAVAESATGGLMASRITDVPGASKVFDLGMTTYADWSKSDELDVDKSFLRKFTAVSSAVAGEMAQGAREKGRADIGVAITGIAGPSSGDYLDKPVGLVYIAVADKSKVIVKKFNFSSMRSRATIREQSVMNAFDMVRRMLTKMDIEDARRFSLAQVAEIEREGPPRKKSAVKAQRTTAIILLLVMAAAGLFGIGAAIRNSLNVGVYDSLRDEYMQVGADGSIAILGFENLSKRNADTLGWLSSSGDGGVDSVVVAGRDNGYYDEYDFDGNRNALGCIHLDERLDLRDTPDNTILYGNSSNAAQQFGPLKSFTDIASLSTQYLLTFDNIYDSAQYKVVSVFYANANAAKGDVQSSYMTSYFSSSEVFTSFVVELKMRSVINIEVDIVSGDTFLTLVTDLTDWDGARLVVIARRVRMGEATEVTSALMSTNIAAAYPQAWYDLHGKTPVYNEVVERDRWTNWLMYNEKNFQSGTSGSSQSGNGVAATDPYFAVTNEGDVVITVLLNGAELTDSPLNIVSRMVAYEIGVSGSDEATKALAVACATQLRYAFESGEIPSLRGNMPNERLVNLVAQVIGTGIYYNGEIAHTPYFEISSGYTYSAEEIYGTPYPYLVSVQSQYDYMAVGYGRTFNFDKEIVRSRIESIYGIKLSDNVKNWIKIMSYAEGGAVKYVSLDGQVMVSGVEFAMACMAIRSPHFTVTVTTTDFSFYNKGYGDGVGMSKAGAELYATQRGWTYEQILTHYYTGIELKELVW